MKPPSCLLFRRTGRIEMTAVSGEILNPSFALIDIVNGVCSSLRRLVIAIFNTHQLKMCGGMIEDINAFEHKCS